MSTLEALPQSIKNVSDDGKNTTGLVENKAGSLMRGLVENGLVYQIKSFNVSPATQAGHEVKILMRFSPKAPWQWLADVAARPEEIALYFEAMIDAHIENSPEHAPLLEQWRADLVRFVAFPDNGFTDFARDMK